MEYESGLPWVTSVGWHIYAVRAKDEGLEIRCSNVGSEKEKKWEIGIYSEIPYFPKESIHQKVLERLKIKEK